MHNDRDIISDYNWMKGGHNRALMAPSVENDVAPKPPDKSRGAAPRDPIKQEQAVHDLSERELKGLLDDALNYRNPQDRVGKSQLFNRMLDVAEEDERNARAARAGGSELVRYCNTSAKKNRHNRKKQSSVSETNKHGGSLNNLADEELFETCKLPTKKSVSARQREGGSLPCNVNASTVTNLEYQFLEEARKKKMFEHKSNAMMTNVNDLESESLLKHDCLDHDYRENTQQIEIQHLGAPIKYTSRATLQVSQVNNVDDAIKMSFLEPKMCATTVTKNAPITLPRVSTTTKPLLVMNDAQNKVVTSAFSFCDLDATSMVRQQQQYQQQFQQQQQQQRMDENGNALQQSTTTPPTKSKKKKLTDRNIVVCKAENVEGHRGDIIDDVDKLLEFLGESRDDKNRIKSKLNRHSSGEDGKNGKNKNSTKNKNKTHDSSAKLTKSNSLGEISTTNLDAEFAEFNKEKVVLRNTNSDAKKTAEKTRERRSWGNVEDALFVSAENLESSSSSAEFRVVTKKKKSRKRRNSISGGGGKTIKQSSHRRVPSPDLRRKSACSVPHSEKSNDDDSSEDDVDSVHSLPIDTQGHHHRNRVMDNMPLSYAQMAKNNEKPLMTIAPKVTNSAVKVPNNVVVVVDVTESVKNNNAGQTLMNPPDVHNVKSFPAITPIKSDKNFTLTSDKNNRISAASGNNNNNKVITKNKIKVGAEQQQQLQRQQITNDFALLASSELNNPAWRLPPDIPDVQTIEKQQLSNCYDDHNQRKSTINATTNTESTAEVVLEANNEYINQTTPKRDCDNNKQPEHHRHLYHQHVDNVTNHNNDNNNSSISSNINNSNSRPPVVILSGLGNNKEVPGLIFGFDINEQLLNDNSNGTSMTMCCEEFILRYAPPENYTHTSHNHDKIVTFISAAWEDALMNVSNNGKVKHYTELL